MPITLYTAPKNGPKINTPAPTVINAGIGNTTTCKNETNIKINAAFAPKDAMYERKSSTVLIFSSKPLFL